MKFFTFNNITYERLSQGWVSTAAPRIIFPSLKGKRKKKGVGG